DLELGRAVQLVEEVQVNVNCTCTNMDFYVEHEVSTEHASVLGSIIRTEDSETEYYMELSGNDSSLIRRAYPDEAGSLVFRGLPADPYMARVKRLSDDAVLLEYGPFSLDAGETAYLGFLPESGAQGILQGNITFDEETASYNSLYLIRRDVGIEHYFSMLEPFGT